jgi:hypothetical protein
LRIDCIVGDKIPFLSVGFLESAVGMEMDNGDGHLDGLSSFFLV